MGDGEAMPFDFRIGGGNGDRESSQFTIDGISRNEAPGDTKSLVVDDQRFANGDAG